MTSKFMLIAVKEAYKGMKADEGGPFGAVVAQRGAIIAKAHNRVIHTNDPTAHAEILAIRKAARKLGRFDLSDCEIFSTCEPCPMCLGAILWARIPKLTYGCTRHDAAAVGFSDSSIYDALNPETGFPPDLTIVQSGHVDCLPLMKHWAEKPDKTPY